MSKRDEMQKMAQNAVTKAAEAMNQANKALSEAQDALRKMEELSLDDLDIVTGGANPLDDPEIERVEDHEISPQLRENA